MTMEDMRARFEGEWILVRDPQTDEALEVISGTVLHHSKDRDEVYSRAVAARPRRCAILYLGQIPADAAVVL